jgi:Flp pilus assembly protein TadD
MVFHFPRSTGLYILAALRKEKIMPQPKVNHLELGLAEFRNGNYGAAVAELELAVVQSRKSFAAWNFLSKAYIMLGQYEKAEEPTMKALGIALLVSDGASQQAAMNNEILHMLRKRSASIAENLQAEKKE